MKLLQRIHLVPGAKQSGLRGTHGDRIKIAVTAPAVDGRANEALRELLAAEHGVPRSRIRIISGLASRDKTVEIEKP